MGWIYERGVVKCLFFYFVVTLIGFGYSAFRSEVWNSGIGGKWVYLGDVGCSKGRPGEPIADPPGVGFPCSVYKQGDKMLFHYPLEGTWRLGMDGPVVRIDYPIVR